MIKLKTRLLQGVKASDRMPSDVDSLRVLHERANRFAKRQVEKQDLKETVSYIRFRLGDNEYYGVPYQYAKEVIHYLLPTSLPSAPHYVQGVINHRGTLLTIIDLKEFFYQQARSYDKTACFIVLAREEISIGIIVDQITGSDSYEVDTLDPPLPAQNLVKLEYIKGLHQGKTAIINVEAVLSDPRFK